MGETMDWGKEASSKWPTYPDGTYKVQIESWEECVSKNKGTPQVKWVGKVRQANDPAHEGGSISCFTPLTSASLWKIANLVQACGIDLSGCGKMDTQGQAFKDVLDSCIHRTTYWTVQYDEEHKNNKIEEFAIDEDQPMIAPKQTADDACPF